MWLDQNDLEIIHYYIWRQFENDCLSFFHRLTLKESYLLSQLRALVMRIDSVLNSVNLLPKLVQRRIKLMAIGSRTKFFHKLVVP